jgi:hypothetical protein
MTYGNSKSRDSSQRLQFYYLVGPLFYFLHRLPLQTAFFLHQRCMSVIWGQMTSLCPLAIHNNIFEIAAPIGVLSVT